MPTRKGKAVNKWKGGIHRHPNGCYALVPNVKGGTGERRYFSSKDAAEEWQQLRGVELWGHAWPEIKATGGYKQKILPRHKKPSASQTIIPGVTDTIRPRYKNGKPTDVLQRQIRVTYMEFTSQGKKRQRVKCFSYGTDKSRYTREEAIELAVKIRVNAEERYSK